MTAITLRDVSKSYQSYAHSWERLREVMTRKSRHTEQVVLKALNLEFEAGSVVGIVGANGAGKSTLLKLIAGTIKPTSGSIDVTGNVAALLELGAGFHPEMTGRENVYLGAAVAGINRDIVESRYADIVAFAGIGEAMSRPVKTYSSGMAARLAFAVAMAIEPEILILDETLSVGDGAFARKSFDRIIDFQKSGKTILFCSHSMYQVEAICDRAIWLDRGSLMMDGDPARVVSAYSEFLGARVEPPNPEAQEQSWVPAQSLAKLVGITVSANGTVGRSLVAKCHASDITVSMAFKADPSMQVPTLGLTMTGGNGWAVTSASSLYDGAEPMLGTDGVYRANLTFPGLALLKGTYWINVFLLCEQGIHLYDSAERVAEIRVEQEGLELGVVSLPRVWNADVSTALLSSGT